MAAILGFMPALERCLSVAGSSCAAANVVPRTPRWPWRFPNA